jgi:hypothetical protein
MDGCFDGGVLSTSPVVLEADICPPNFIIEMIYGIFGIMGLDFVFLLILLVVIE